MTEVGVQFSITDAPLQVVTKATMLRRRKSPSRATPDNLFNHARRSHPNQYSAMLPIISLSPLSDFKEKFARMATNNKSIKQPTRQSPTLTEFRLKTLSPDMSQPKSRLSSSNRSVASSMPKSSLSYPTILPRAATPYRSNHHHQQQQQQQQQPQQPGARFLYVVKTPTTSRRSSSARITHNNNLNPLPLHQQPHLLASPLLPRPHPQYGHFLAYLRRQSLARIRRKQQQQEEGVPDGIETMVTFSSTRPTPPLFQSVSHVSFGASAPETASFPTISLQSKRKPRPLSSYRFMPRSTPASVLANYRLNLNETPPLKPPPPSPRIILKKPPEAQPLVSTHTTVLLTPTNSLVNETIMSPTKKAPYELQLTGDTLNYCYVSDSGVKYQGQLLSSAV